MKLFNFRKFSLSRFNKFVCLSFFCVKRVDVEKYQNFPCVVLGIKKILLRYKIKILLRSYLKLNALLPKFFKIKIEEKKFYFKNNFQKNNLKGLLIIPRERQNEVIFFLIKNKFHLKKQLKIKIKTLIKVHRINEALNFILTKL